MDLEKLFSQLKTIEPQKEFTEYSRRIILASAHPHSRFEAMKHVLIDTFRMGTAIALASALVLLIVNATFLWKVLPTPHVAVLDPTGLRAEAQAIDIQIQLANLNFGDLALNSSTVSTNPVAEIPNNGHTAAKASATEQPWVASGTAVGNAAGAETQPTSSAVGIDSALKELGK